MGTGPNHLLDKGMLATGTGAYRRGMIVQQVATVGDGQAVVKATPTLVTADPLAPLYVCMEDVDASRINTGKHILSVRPLGIARVVTGATFPKWSRITCDANSFAIAATRTAAGAVPAPVLGIAMKANTVSTVGGNEVEVLIQPGLPW